VADELFLYQDMGAFWLTTHSKCILADEMGLGKSAQVVEAVELLKLQNIYIICKAVGREIWVDEFEKWGSREYEFVLIKERGRLNCHKKINLEHSTPRITLVSYELADELLILLRDANAKDYSFVDLLVCDEFHMLKSIHANRAHQILGNSGIIRKAKRCWMLSGTPAPNHAGELWIIMRTFGATDLSFIQFVEYFCITAPNPYAPIGGEPRIVGTNVERIPELRELLKPFMLRRMKKDVMKQLPPIYFREQIVNAGDVDVDVEAHLVQYVFPHDRLDELEMKLEEERALVENLKDVQGKNTNAFANSLMAMSKSVSTLRMYTGMQKTQPVADLIEDELNDNTYDKVVIFAIHQSVIEGLRKRLRKFKAVTLYGGTPPEKRVANIEKFQNNPKCRVFIGNIQAAGTTITLPAAHNVVFAEQSWVPGENAQAAMRCHRIGQTKPVNVRFIALKDSIDRHVAGVLKRKTKELTEIFDK